MRNLREDHDLSQSQVANYLHIGQTTYSQYELGKRSLPIEYLIKLCEFYRSLLIICSVFPIRNNLRQLFIQKARRRFFIPCSSCLKLNVHF